MRPIDNEWASPPPETVFPAPEQAAPAPEIQPPPPEFGSSGRAEEQPKKKRRLLKRYLALPVILLLGYLTFAGAGQAKPPVTAEPSSQQTSLPDETEQPSTDVSEPSSEEETTEKEYVAPYPLADRTMVITVYAYTMGEDFTFPTLLQETLNEQGFESMELPAFPPLDGYTFSGWVIHIGNPVMHPEEEPVGSTRTLITLTGQTLLKADVEKAPIASDGVRYVDIFPVLIPQSEPTADAPSFILDDGNGNRHEYADDSPLYSEGFHYIFAYPETKRPGYIFGGWFTEDGRPVSMLQSYMDLYEPLQYDEYGNVLDCDWSKPLHIVLTARWYPEE